MYLNLPKRSTIWNGEHIYLEVINWFVNGCDPELPSPHAGQSTCMVLTYLTFLVASFSKRPRVIVLHKFSDLLVKSFLASFGHSLGMKAYYTEQEKKYSTNNFQPLIRSNS
jgi:hypothetical protein